MPRRIEDLLHRRTDLSTFLVHFTRPGADQLARDRLFNILREHQLQAGRPLGMAAAPATERRISNPAFYQSQCVVCFTETPLEHAWMMCEDIEKREATFSPYGLAFTKTWGRIKGINPVWYLDITPTGNDWLTNPINRMVDEAIAAGNFDHDIFRLTPFIEQMGATNARTRKEFWWEREWRLAGANLWFLPDEIVALLAPEADHAALRRELSVLHEQQYGAGYFEGLRVIDPRWGLERMIASLAGVPNEYAGPWPGR